jgi:hypothetical protein
MASVGGSAAGEDISGTVSLSPCSALSGSSYNRVPAAATDAWRIAGHITALNEDSGSFSLTWQRVREGGRDVQSAPQSRTFTLPMGGRESLDELASPAVGSCPEHHVTLDVTVDRRPVSRKVIGGGSTSVIAGGPGTRATNKASGSPTQGGTSAGDAVAGSQGVGGAGAPLALVVGAGGQGAMLKRAFPLVELWLVHTAPGQPDRTEHQQVQAAPFTRAATFAPATIAASAGVFTVTVECFVETGLTPAGEPRLFVTATRKVSFVPANGPARDVRPLVEGSIKTAVERPGPNDVLAFELPAIQYPGAPSVPDRFSIRLKLGG